MFKQATVTTEPTRSIRRQAADNGLNASFVSNVGLIERLASLAIGAAVVLIVTRRLLFNFCLAVIGIYLLYRVQPAIVRSMPVRGLIPCVGVHGGIGSKGAKTMNKSVQIISDR